MTSLILYTVTILFYILSFNKDKDKTLKAFLIGKNSLFGIMPQFLGIILTIGITLSLIEPELISAMLGDKSGFMGIIMGAIVGSIAMMPTFVAFSTGNMLLLNGAGIAQATAFMSTLTLIGIITIPLESKHIGKKATFYRNVLAFLYSVVVAIFIERVMKAL